jgi:excisionase family DNA binding protein
MTMNAKMSGGKAAPSDEALLSVAEAAQLLRISQSTLWRWIGEARVPAYRMGPKRVWLKRTDLDLLMNPARTERREDDTPRTVGQPLTAVERARRLAAIEKARKFQARVLASRGGKPFGESSELLHEMREERMRQLE